MITKAERKAVPVIASIAGTSGSGKTYSALLMAAGLAGENGKVGFIDTEAGRGSMYADDPDIINAMPGGEYYIDTITNSFSPDKYIEKIKQFIDFGVTVLVIDSMTHEWEGQGGCQDMVEKYKGGNERKAMPAWARAKMAHKKLMNFILQSPVHIIFCLRAKEKSKPVQVFKNGKTVTEIINDGLQPIQEKNFMYEMTLSMMLEESSPGKPIITKCPKPLLGLFQGEQPIISKETGEKLREWADGGADIDKRLRELILECNDAATFGSSALSAFKARLTPEEKKILKNGVEPTYFDEMLAIAKEVDEQDEIEANEAEFRNE